MKIKTDTPDLLIVEDTPWLFAIMVTIMTLVFIGIGMGLVFSGEWMGLFFAVIGGGLGLLFFFLIVRRVQVVFYRPEGWVEIRRANVLRRATVRHQLDEVSRAIVQRTSGDSGDLHRVTLEIDHGESAGQHPLTIAYSNTGDHHGVARAINDWLSAR